jgi:hypothetical protein
VRPSRPSASCGERGPTAKTPSPPGTPLAQALAARPGAPATDSSRGPTRDTLRSRCRGGGGRTVPCVHAETRVRLPAFPLSSSTLERHWTARRPLKAKGLGSSPSGVTTSRGRSSKAEQGTVNAQGAGSSPAVPAILGVRAPHLADVEHRLGSPGSYPGNHPFDSWVRNHSRGLVQRPGCPALNRKVEVRFLGPLPIPPCGPGFQPGVLLLAGVDRRAGKRSLRAAGHRGHPATTQGAAPECGTAFEAVAAGVSTQAPCHPTRDTLLRRCRPEAGHHVACVGEHHYREERYVLRCLRHDPARERIPRWPIDNLTSSS